MAISRQDFFDKKSKGALWDVGVSIKRGNPLPLDADAVFESYSAAETYAQGVIAYPGQIIAVVNENSTEIYYLDQNCALQEVGGKVSVDGKSLVSDENGTISINGFDTAQEGYQIKVVNKGTTSEPDLQLVFFEPDTTTVEGLTETVRTHTNQINQLQSDVTTNTGSIQSLTTNLADNYYNKTEVDGLVSGAFHFKGVADSIDESGNLIIDGKILTTMKNGDVYQIDNKEYVYDGTSWVELGFNVDLSNYATTAAVATAKQEAIDAAATDATTKANAAETNAKSYVETQLESYSTTTEVEGLIDTAKTDLNNNIATAKQEAISEAGTNADTKITNKVGDVGEKTVKQYIDDADNALAGRISTLETTTSNLGTLATLNEVGEAQLATALKTKIDNKADSATTLAGYGITDAYTKTEVTDAISTAKTEAAETAQSKIDGKIATLNKVDTAVEGKYVSAVSESNGVITVERADLPNYDNTYDAKGSASAVLGQSTDTSDQVTVYGTRKYVDEEVAKKVGSVSASDKSIVVEGTTSPTVKVNIDNTEGNALTLNDNGLRVEIPTVSIPEYTLAKKSVAEDGYFASYELQKDGTKVGETINIPKDYLVKSAEIKESTGEGDPSGFDTGVKYIDFTINTQGGTGNESHIYLNVQELVDAYTGGNGINISASNEISVKVVEGNGLSVDAEGIKLALATDTNPGAMSSAEKASIADSASKVVELKSKVSTLETTTSNLATIATTGNVNDLVQTEGDYLILDCGGAN